MSIWPLSKHMRRHRETVTVVGQHFTTSPLKPYERHPQLHYVRVLGGIHHYRCCVLWKACGGTTTKAEARRARQRMLHSYCTEATRAHRIAPTTAGWSDLPEGQPSIIIDCLHSRENHFSRALADIGLSSMTLSWHSKIQHRRGSYQRS